MLEIRCQCRMCGKVKVVKVPQAGYQKWMDGALIQDALPNVSADDRELMISKTCPSCFEELFSDDE